MKSIKDLNDGLKGLGISQWSDRQISFLSTVASINDTDHECQFLFNESVGAPSEPFDEVLKVQDLFAVSMVELLTIGQYSPKERLPYLVITLNQRIVAKMPFYRQGFRLLAETDMRWIFLAGIMNIVFRVVYPDTFGNLGITYAVMTLHGELFMDVTQLVDEKGNPIKR